MLAIFGMLNVFATEDELIPSTLLESVVNSDLDGIDRAIEAGENIDLVNDKGWSAAMFAVNLGDMEVLQKLIDYQIDLNNADNEGVSPLIAAAAAVWMFRSCNFERRLS